MIKKRTRSTDYAEKNMEFLDLGLPRKVNAYAKKTIRALRDEEHKCYLVYATQGKIIKYIHGQINGTPDFVLPEYSHKIDNLIRKMKSENEISIFPIICNEVEKKGIFLFWENINNSKKMVN